MSNYAVNSRHEPLLEICYPTFNRIEACILNVREALKCEDSRFKIHISSNCPAPELVNAFSGNGKIKVHEFETNQGFALNVKYLLVTSYARYKLLMSDEDAIDSANLIRLLDFLDSPAASDSIYYLPSKDNYSLGSLVQLKGRDLNFNQVMLTHPMNPTYLSGYIFPSTKYQNLQIDTFFEGWPTNAYPFIKLRNFILQRGSQFMILPNISLNRGVAIEYGGTTNDDLYSMACRENQFHNFIFGERENQFSSPFIRFTSSILIANQIQSGMNSKVFFQMERRNDSDRNDFAIKFITRQKLTDLPSIFFSQLLIKAFQKLSGVYRMYLLISRKIRY